jgi:hypothetical protein
MQPRNCKQPPTPTRTGHVLDAAVHGLAEHLRDVRVKHGDGHNSNAGRLQVRRHKVRGLPRLVLVLDAEHGDALGVARDLGEEMGGVLLFFLCV